MDRPKFYDQNSPARIRLFLMSVVICILTFGACFVLTVAVVSVVGSLGWAFTYGDSGAPTLLVVFVNIAIFLGAVVAPTVLSYRQIRAYKLKQANKVR